MRIFIILAACFMGSTSLFAQQADTLKRQQHDDGTVNLNSAPNNSNHNSIAEHGTTIIKYTDVNTASITVHDTITVNGKRAVEFEDGTWKYLDERSKVISK